MFGSGGPTRQIAAGRIVRLEDDQTLGPNFSPGDTNPQFRLSACVGTPRLLPD